MKSTELVAALMLRVAQNGLGRNTQRRGMVPGGFGTCRYASQLLVMVQ